MDEPGDPDRGAGSNQESHPAHDVVKGQGGQLYLQPVPPLQEDESSESSLNFGPAWSQGDALPWRMLHTHIYIYIHYEYPFRLKLGGLNLRQKKDLACWGCRLLKAQI